MNDIEKIIYDFVKKNPRLKNSVRDVYQLLFSLIPVKQKTINQTLINRSGYFFGFHDKSPWSFDDEYLLAHKFTIANCKLTENDTVEIGIFSGHNYENFKPLAVTPSFNWQQGCMLQWVGNKREIIYNSFDGKKHISILIDCDGKELKRFSLPIAAVSPDGKLALSYNFARLRKYAPAYGYESGVDTEAEIQTPKKEGISLINIENGEIKQLFTVDEIASIKPIPSMQNSFHYLTHCLFAPDSKRFVFYHRNIRHMNFVSTRMFSCNLDGSDKFIFPTNGMVSHIGWQTNTKILAYCNSIKYGDAYTLFEDRKNEYELIGEQQLSSDGHPSFSPADRNLFITDTYPNRFRLITLILFDCLKNKRTDLAQLKQPLQFKDELRCDFHPRWNRKGTMICFDSAHSGKRSLCTLNIAYELKIGTQ